MEVLSWNDLVAKRWQDLIRMGLPGEKREALKKYTLSDAVAFLRVPRLNPECIAELKSNSIVKRDKYFGKNQDQVVVVLCTFSEVDF